MHTLLRRLLALALPVLLMGMGATGAEARFSFGGAYPGSAGVQAAPNYGYLNGNSGYGGLPGIATTLGSTALRGYSNQARGGYAAFDDGLFRGAAPGGSSACPWCPKPGGQAASFAEGGCPNCPGGDCSFCQGNCGSNCPYCQNGNCPYCSDGNCADCPFCSSGGEQLAGLNPILPPVGDNGFSADQGIRTYGI